MHSIISGISALEIIAYLIGVLLFFSSPKAMAYIFLHTLHPVRGVIGFLIIKRLPRSHDIVKELELTDENEKVDFEQFRNKVTDKLR